MKCLSSRCVGHKSKSLFFLLISCILSFIAFDSYGQSRIAGQIEDPLHKALEGVSVYQKGTSNGTVSDLHGRFEMTVNPGDTLVFSFVGYETQEVLIRDQSALKITLTPASEGLSEIVVSALGLKKEKSSLPYNIQQITGDEVSNMRTPNLVSSLSGKVLGGVITGGNAGPASSANVVIRGVKSISGTNQPLYVIDGIPMANANTTQLSELNDIVPMDQGDAISNLNPVDIESISILTGGSAAALYGSQAANGAVIINTKSGRPNESRITISSSTTFTRPFLLPEIQTNYGQGLNGNSDHTINDSWGPQINDGSDRHLKDFFRTGKDLSNSIIFDKGFEEGYFHLAYLNNYSEGIVPTNGLSRNNVKVKGSYNFLNDKLRITSSMNFISQISRNILPSGWFNSPMFGLYLFPVGDDFSKYSGDKYQVFDEIQNIYTQNWPYIRNEASANQNPFWILNKIPNSRKRDRGIYNFVVDYELLDWLSLKGRINYDKTNDVFEQKISSGSDPTVSLENGGYRYNPSSFTQFYGDFLMVIKEDFNEVFSLDATLGVSAVKNIYEDLNLANDQTNSSLYFPNYFSVSNLENNFIHRDSKQYSLSQAVFGDFNLGYKNTLFLNLTGRGERISTVDKEFFYPSIGLSYVVSNSFQHDDYFLSSLKIRGVFSKVGSGLNFGVSNFQPDYFLSTSGSIEDRVGIPFFDGADTLDLKPEMTDTYEFGVEGSFFASALNIRFNYYHSLTKDQLFGIGAPPGSGANVFWINGGEIINKGIEFMISYNKSFNSDWKLESFINFSHNINEVKSLSSRLDADNYRLAIGHQDLHAFQILLAGPHSSILDNKKSTGSLGDLFGKVYVRDEKGKKVVDSDGLPVLSEKNNHYLGNTNPDYIAGFGNDLTYKRFRLHFLFTGRFGGIIGSDKEQWLDFKGLSKRSGIARSSGGVILDNGNTVDAQKYYRYISGSAQAEAAGENYVYPISNIRLREVSLAYEVPLKSNFVKNIGISVMARNLFFLYKKAPFDPELNLSLSNSFYGIDSFQEPSVRSFGLSVNASF